MLVSPTLAILTLFIEPMYLLHCLIWIILSRTILCLFLFRYARSTDLSWPFILYFNQIINACVKVFMIFHLSKQKWANRGNQSVGDGMGFSENIQNWTAKFQLITTVCAFIVGLAVYIGLLPMPVIL
jgi:glycosyltransferase Alg8